MPWVFLTLMPPIWCLGCFLCALRKPWRTFSKASESLIVNTDLYAVINLLITKILELSHQLYWATLLQSPFYKLTSSSGEVVMYTVYCSYLRPFLSLKVSEMLFQIMQSSINTSGVTETYKPANHMPFQTQLQTFQHSSECFKLTSFSATLWPPSANATDVVSRQ